MVCGSLLPEGSLEFLALGGPHLHFPFVNGIVHSHQLCSVEMHSFIRFNIFCSLRCVLLLIREVKFSFSYVLLVCKILHRVFNVQK